MEGGAGGRGVTRGEAHPSASADNKNAATADIHRHELAARSYPAPMGLLLLEALAVLGIAIFIVWWTMFSGRGKHDAAAPVSDDLGDDSGSGTESNAPNGRGPSGSTTRGNPGVD